MNSLEHFNKFYLEEKYPAVSGSLVNFFKTVVHERIPNVDVKILELGCGSRSLFEDLEFKYKNIAAIDFSEVAIEKAPQHSGIIYKVVDLTAPFALGDMSFDLIFDSHCLHCIEGTNDRKTALENIREALTADGLFCAEMMVQPSKGFAYLPLKHIPKALELEEELLASGFKINYFMISKSMVFHNENGECELLRVVCRK